MLKKQLKIDRAIFVRLWNDYALTYWKLQTGLKEAVWLRKTQLQDKKANRDFPWTSIAFQHESQLTKATLFLRWKRTKLVFLYRASIFPPKERPFEGPWLYFTFTYWRFQFMVARESLQFSVKFLSILENYLQHCFPLMVEPGWNVRDC